jgi:hypothetical protein
MGAAKRSAKWLHEVVGVGKVFTKAQLREAVPDREQVDRRMRQLREIGWVIHTSSEDASLSNEQLRVVTEGEQPWVEGYRWPPTSRVSGRARRTVFDRDGNRCVVCGVASGEPYPHEPTKIARMTIGHLLPTGRRGTNDPENLRTECSLCNETSRHLTSTPVDPELVKAEIRALSRSERAELRVWIAENRRRFTKTEALWAKYRQLPAPVRDQVKRLIDELP